MATQNQQLNYKKPHFLLGANGKTEPFQPRSGGGSKSILPQRDRNQHGSDLLSQIQGLNPQFEEARERQKEAGLEEGFGLQIEFESFPDFDLAFNSLARERSGIELLNVRHNDQQTLATVFVPEGKLTIFENLIKGYLDKSKDKKNGPKNRRLVDTISKIRSATIKALWTDEYVECPSDENTTLWWEIWLTIPVQEMQDNSKRSSVEKFKQLAQDQGFRFAQGQLDFPERTVLLVFGSVKQMKQSILVLNRIAELRQARETAEFFDRLPPQEQAEWLEDLQGRLTAPSVDDAVPYLCILDTGVNYGHPLLELVLDQTDLHTVNPEWSVNDDAGHGTEMAGLATIGDLTEVLSSQAPLKIPHRLESVKLLNDDHTSEGEPKLHGYLTVEAVARPEITAPKRKRVFSMAITAYDQKTWGRPSAWSAAVDRLTSDADSNGETPRLFLISAGNTDNLMEQNRHHKNDHLNSIQDPGQSWNALTVGASTKLVQLSDHRRESHNPVAPEGGLSPLTTTSKDWESKWPLKPDVVEEGGNLISDSLGQWTSPDLSLLTTHFKPNERHFTITSGTSASTALVARSAAQLMAEYPNLWPQTIRALIVHSATWTEAMEKEFLPDDPKKRNKGNYAWLIRHCGFGIPNLDRAMWSVQNSLTMICEDKLQPFHKCKRNNNIITNEMKIHPLPWPTEALQNLGPVEVEMKVTLSYFIEPNPSARPPTSQYRYESHGLRFDVKRPTESEKDFRRRINEYERRKEDIRDINPTDGNWVVGKNCRKGSLHSDIWRGSAAELASRDMIGIYPVTGWWKTRKKLNRYNSSAFYALVVSIHAPNVKVNLYEEISNKLPVTVSVD